MPTRQSRKITIAILTKGPWLRYPYLVASELQNTLDCQITIICETTDIPARSQTMAQRILRLSKNYIKQGLQLFRIRDAIVLPNVNLDVIDSGLNSSECVAKIKLLEPDYAINAWGTIFRKPLLDVLKGRLLNAHMGELPSVRGMNAAEWSILLGQRIGNTVHIIDEGIDTGPVLGFYPLEATNITTVAKIREKLELASPANITDALVNLEQGTTAPKYQNHDDGKQYFSMHPNLKALLPDRLANL